MDAFIVIMNHVNSFSDNSKAITRMKQPGADCGSPGKSQMDSRELFGAGIKLLSSNGSLPSRKAYEEKRFDSWRGA
jgi:hypothetical protein